MSGYKTYIAALVIGLAAAAHSLGLLGDVAYQTIIGLSGAGGLAALRAAIAK